MIDLASRPVVDWALADDMRTDLIADALDMLSPTATTNGAICPSDRGRLNPRPGRPCVSYWCETPAGMEADNLAFRWGEVAVTEHRCSRRVVCASHALRRRREVAGLVVERFDFSGHGEGPRRQRSGPRCVRRPWSSSGTCGQAARRSPQVTAIAILPARNSRQRFPSQRMERSRKPDCFSISMTA